MRGSPDGAGGYERIKRGALGPTAKVAPVAHVVQREVLAWEVHMHTPIERELLSLERQYWQAIKDKDPIAALQLTDDPCFVTGAQGVGRIDRETLPAMMKAAPYTLLAFEVKNDVQVHLLGKDVAIVAYNVHEDLTVEGKRVSLDAADASTWVRRGGRWLCALHTEAVVGDPYGRDRASVQR